MLPVKVGEARGAFKSNAFCVAVETGLSKSVVLFTLPKPTIVAVMPETVPVKVGEASGAFKSKAVWVAVEIGLSKSVVLSTFAKPTIVAVIPETVPEKVGEASGAFSAKSELLAFASNAVCVAVEMGLSKSVVLFTLAKPTIVAVMPETVPVKVGEASGAFKSRAV